MSDVLPRLTKFLRERGYPANDIVTINPDASNREYFRIKNKSGTVVACVYPKADDPAASAYLDVTHLFKLSDLPVPEILDFDLDAGVIIQEDLGDISLNSHIRTASSQEKECRIGEAIALIAKIQNATKLAVSIDSIAGRQKFDFEKLMWELEFFFSHYTSTLNKLSLSDDLKNAVYREFEVIARKLAENAAVLCHRDFHSYNLMIDSKGKLRIIDHQDARLGSPTYDLVSLLLDRVAKPPDYDWIIEKQAELLSERLKLGLPHLDQEEFDKQFRLQAIQRCLKAVGTFSYQAAVRGKSGYLLYIEPMLETAANAARSFSHFPALVGFLDRESARLSDRPPASF